MKRVLQERIASTEASIRDLSGQIGKRESEIIHLKENLTLAKAVVSMFKTMSGEEDKKEKDV